MTYKNKTHKEIKVKSITDKYVYYSIPENIRYNRITKEFEKLKKNEWVIKAKSKTTNKPGSQLRIFISPGNTFACSRLIATALIPNPNNYSQITFKDHNSFNLSEDNLEWSEPSEFIQFAEGNVPFTEEEFKTLKAIPQPHNFTNKEYAYFMNHRIGPDGLNKAQRFAMRSKGTYDEYLKDYNTFKAKSDKEKFKIKLNKEKEDLSEYTEEAIKTFFLNKPKFNPITHLVEGYILPTNDELDKYIKESNASENVKLRAKQLLPELLCKTIMACNKAERDLKSIKSKP